VAIAATMQWELDSATGNDANGGGFDDTSGTPGTNYAWGAGQTAIAYTDIRTDGANLNVMVSNGPARAFVAADVGNVINLTGGTHITTGRYQILSVAVGKATVDRNFATEDTAAHNDGAGTLGGALASITAAFIQDATTPMVAGNKLWIKYNAVAYSLPSAITAGVAGTAVLPILFSGYYASHGDNPTIASGHQPTIAHSTYNWTFSNHWSLHALTFTIATTGGRFGLTLGSTNQVLQGKVTQTAGGKAVFLQAACIVEGCECIGGTPLTHGGPYTKVLDCYIHDCATGILANFSGQTTIVDNVIDTCSTGIDLVNYSNTIVHGNTIVNCSVGISATTSGGDLVQNNVIAFCGNGLLWTTKTDTNLFRGNNIYGCDTPSSGVATTGSYAPIGGTTADPEFVTEIATGTTATTNAAPGTTFTATGLLAGVTTHDYLCVWSGTGATAGVYAISSVAGAPDSITLATSPGASASAIKWGIVKGGTATDLSLAATSDCIGAGYGLSLGVGAHVSTPSQGAWETGSAGGGGYTYGDEDPTEVLTTATGAGTYQPVAAADVREGTDVGVSPSVGTLAVPAASDVRFGTDVDATTGTCYVPAADDVQSGVAVDATTGTFTSPAVGKVLNDTSWGAGGVEFTGTFDASNLAVGNVIQDVAFGVGLTGTGANLLATHTAYLSLEAGRNSTTAAAAQILTGYSVTIAGSTTNGSFDAALYTLISGVAAAADVRLGVARYSGGGNGSLVGVVDSTGTLHAYGTCSSTQAWDVDGIIHTSGTAATSGILTSGGGYYATGILSDANTYYANGTFSSAGAYNATGVIYGAGSYATEASRNSTTAAAGDIVTGHSVTIAGSTTDGTLDMSLYCLVAGITWPALDEVDGGVNFGPVTGTEYEGTGVDATAVQSACAAAITAAAIPAGTVTALGTGSTLTRLIPADIYSYEVQVIESRSLATPSDTYVVVPYENLVEVPHGDATLPTITVKDHLGNTLINAAVLVEIGTTGRYQYVSTALQIPGRVYTIDVSMTIGGSARTGQVRVAGRNY
jgi:hypothetical protein